MVQAAKNKELTVKQYEFYKRKGMADTKVMSLHGLNNASLNAWKKEHNLVGVKFEPELKTSAVKTVSAKSVEEQPELLKENDVPKAKWEDVAKNINNYSNSVPLSNDAPQIEPIPQEELEKLSEPVSEEKQEPALTTVKGDDLQGQIEWLEGRHADDQELIHTLRMDLKEANKELYTASERANEWEELYLLADREVAELKLEIQRMNELLEQAHQKDKMLTGVMKMYVDVKERAEV